MVLLVVQVGHVQECLDLDSSLGPVLHNGIFDARLVDDAVRDEHTIRQYVDAANECRAREVALDRDGVAVGDRDVADLRDRIPLIIFRPGELWTFLTVGENCELDFAVGARLVDFHL